MANVITGLIGLVLLFVFFGFYAVKLDSVPLWIIIVAILVMVSIDFVQSIRNNGR